MSEKTKVTDSTCSVTMEEEWKGEELAEQFITGNKEGGGMSDNMDIQIFPLRAHFTSIHNHRK